MSRAQFTVAISTDEQAAASKRMVIYAFSAQINLFTSICMVNLMEIPRVIVFFFLLHDCLASVFSEEKGPTLVWLLFL